MIGFQPIIPQSGFGGWSFLQRTQEAQRSVFEKSPEMRRDIEYFRENISNAGAAEDLVNDRRLLKVALGAFGLDDDLNKRAYVLKVLAEGTESDDAFANRIVDKRYHALAEAFGYGNDSGARVQQSNFAETIVAPYKVKQFEISVGDRDQSMRLALGFLREISEHAASDSSEKSVWYRIMGNPPLRSVFETAFGLPVEFGSLDIEQQLGVFREKSAKLFGDSSPQVFQNPKNVDKLLQTFFVRKQLAENPTAGIRGTVALSLLQNSTAAMDNFFKSRL